MSNPLEDMFGNTNSAAVQERANAAKGHCPEARKCSDKADLAGWFKSFGVACGVVAKSGMCE